MSALSRYNDINILIREIEQIRINLNDPCLGPVFWEEAMKTFITRHAGDLLEMLEELRELRDRTGDRPADGGTHRVIVEGFSDKSAAAALSDAIDKASHYFSEQHDISITLQQLVELPRGGHRALMEIHITPMTLKNRCHPQGQDVELKRINDRDYARRKKLDSEHIGHLIFDHFAARSGGGTPPIPDHFLININDAQLMNDMIEKQFFDAGHNKPAPDASPAPVQQVLVRVQSPMPEPRLKKRDS